MQEKLSEEFDRLIREFREAPDGSNTMGEAWNLIADFSETNSQAISTALRAYEE